MLLELTEAAFAAITKWLFMIVKLSAFGFHWVSVIILPRSPREQSLQDFGTRYKNFDDVLIICYKKTYWLTKMTDVDPSIVGPLKNNYFKACSDYCNH